MKDMPEFKITPRSGKEEYDRIEIELHGKLVGNVRCFFRYETVIVYSIQVFPEFQGNGYGVATIEMLKQRFRVLVADRVRFTARGFWEREGFKELPDGNWEYRRPD